MSRRRSRSRGQSPDPEPKPSAALAKASAPEPAVSEPSAPRRKADSTPAEKASRKAKAVPSSASLEQGQPAAREEPFPWTGHLAVAGTFAAALFGGALALTLDERFESESSVVLMLALLLALLVGLATVADALADRFFPE
jgi:hypothetical protein